MAYSSNKFSVALYPICVEYKVQGVLKKGGIIFISMTCSRSRHLRRECLRLPEEKFHTRLTTGRDGLMVAAANSGQNSAMLVAHNHAMSSTWNQHPGSTSSRMKGRTFPILMYHWWNVKPSGKWIDMAME